MITVSIFSPDFMVNPIRDSFASINLSNRTAWKGVKSSIKKDATYYNLCSNQLIINSLLSIICALLHMSP